MKQIITQEKFTNIQNAQAGLTKLFRKAKKEKSFYRVMRNDEPLGVLVPNEVWEDFLEDMEAAASENYKKRVAKARKEKKSYSLEEVMDKLDLH